MNCVLQQGLGLAPAQGEMSANIVHIEDVAQLGQVLFKVGGELISSVTVDITSASRLTSGNTPQFNSLD